MLILILFYEFADQRDFDESKLILMDCAVCTNQLCW